MQKYRVIIPALIIILLSFSVSCSSAGKMKIKGLEPPIEGLVWGDSAEMVQRVLGPAAKIITTPVTLYYYENVKFLGEKGTLALTFDSHGAGLITVSFDLDDKEDAGDAFREAVQSKLGNDGSLQSSEKIADLPEITKERILNIYSILGYYDNFGTWEEQQKLPLKKVSLGREYVVFSGTYQALANQCADDQTYEELVRELEKAIDDADSNITETVETQYYIPNFTTQELRDLYETEPYSELLPRMIPSGLAFKYSYLTEDDPVLNAKGGFLAVVFDSEQNYLEIQINEYDVTGTFADPEKPETYKLELYYGPLENDGALGANLPNVFAPFNASDVTKEIASARIYNSKNGTCTAQIDMICDKYLVSYFYHGNPITGDMLFECITSSGFFEK